jgi:hypothetical protein
MRDPGTSDGPWAGERRQLPADRWAIGSGRRPVPPGRRRASSGRSIHWLSLAAIVGLLLPFFCVASSAFAAVTYGPGAAGFDISFPECQRAYPSGPSGLAVVGVTGGKTFTLNPCFASEYHWASAAQTPPAFYMNLNFPGGATAAYGQHGPWGTCAANNLACHAYNYGANAAQWADQHVRSLGIPISRWWLDVEVANYWTGTPALNALVIQGAIDYLHGQHEDVGIYSVPFMWQQIAGSYAPGVPTWVAQTSARVPAMAYCAPSHSFGGGPVTLVQSWNGQFDLDYACHAGVTAPLRLSPESVVVPAAPAAPPVRLGTADHPIGLNAPASGKLSGTTGGKTTYFTFYYPGKLGNQVVTLDFSPKGIDTANGLYVTVYQNGTALAHAHAVDTPSPGHLVVPFWSSTGGAIVVQLANFNPASRPAVTYTIRH